ncbi:hypothetical protein FCM35_KLT07790 [Carex littledalei]|uniref:Uncharacterized protein n=1 Tax=Carex littledalei TaxID=544730 RepID=A0A833V7K9_9POAL|nr:hypothetical protein FCM35_KLT07790 [Carex littledalei]
MQAITVRQLNREQCLSDTEREEVASGGRAQPPPPPLTPNSIVCEVPYLNLGPCIWEIYRQPTIGLVSDFANRLAALCAKECLNRKRLTVRVAPILPCSVYVTDCIFRLDLFFTVDGMD